ncbi:Protein of unknown function [Gryllus bimaculatus]|nr:Protein of unknown function [Gryllus bimaculatus]
MAAARTAALGNWKSTPRHVYSSCRRVRALAGAAPNANSSDRNSGRSSGGGGDDDMALQDNHTLCTRAKRHSGTVEDGS